MRGRIGLFLLFPWHAPILARLHALLQAAGPTLMTGDAAALARFAPGIVVVCDWSPIARLRQRLPDALFVHTRHGLISKNQAPGFAAADYVCVASDCARDLLIAQGGVPRRAIWVTGYLQMDPLFRADLAPAIERPPRSTVLLFAPTYNRHLSAAEPFGDRLVELLRGEDRSIAVIIKPHPHIAVVRPDWLALWRRLSEECEKVFLVDPPSADVVPYLKAADLLVSDASSVIFQFLARDRPILLVTNPQRAEDGRYFDPAGIEWQWRDIADEIEDVAEAPAAVRRALAEPDRRAAARRRCRDRLFGPLQDGYAAERIAAHIREIAA